jgi:hypothetical protein
MHQTRDFQSVVLVPPVVCELHSGYLWNNWDHKKLLHKINKNIQKK